MRLALDQEGRFRSLRMSLSAALCTCARSFLSSCAAATWPCASRHAEQAASGLGNGRVWGKCFRSVRQTYKKASYVVFSCDYELLLFFNFHITSYANTYMYVQHSRRGQQCKIYRQTNLFRDQAPPNLLGAQVAVRAHEVRVEAEAVLRDEVRM